MDSIFDQWTRAISFTINVLNRLCPIYIFCLENTNPTTLILLFYYFRTENNRLEKKLDDAKRNLEDETLKRIDLQNQLQTSQEGLKFENQLLEQQLNETRVRKQIEISEIDGKLSDQYEEKLQKNLAVS